MMPTKAVLLAVATLQLAWPEPSVHVSSQQNSEASKSQVVREAALGTRLMSFIYKDIPRIELPVQLSAGVPITFQARIVEKRNYWLNLRVYFDNKDQRKAVSDFIGGALGQPGNQPYPVGTPTDFRIVVRNEGNQVVYEKTKTSNGRSSTTEKSLQRRLDEFILGKGVYAISVTPISVRSQLATFGTSLELTYHPNSTAID